MGSHCPASWGWHIAWGIPGARRCDTCSLPSSPGRINYGVDNAILGGSLVEVIDECLGTFWNCSPNGRCRHCSLGREYKASPTRKEEKAGTKVAKPRCIGICIFPWEVPVLSTPILLACKNLDEKVGCSCQVPQPTTTNHPSLHSLSPSSITTLHQLPASPRKGHPSYQSWPLLPPNLSAITPLPGRR